MYECKRKILVSLCLFWLNSNFLWAKEYTVEVKLNTGLESANLSDEEINRQLLLKGMEETIYQKLALDGLNVDLFKSKILEKKLSREKYEEFLSSFFLKKSLLKNNGNDSIPQGMLNSEVIEDAVFKDKISEFVDDLENYKNKNFYFYFDLNLMGTTKWDDLGVSSEDVFIEVVTKSWRDYLLLSAKNFKNIIFVDSKIKDILDKKNTIVHPESVELRFNVSVKKVFENKTTQKANFEFNSHFVLLNIKDRSILLSEDLPIQKKEFSIKSRQDFSSTMATFVYNLAKVNLANIVAASEAKKSNSELVYDLKGAKFFSDVSKVQLLLEKYLLNYKIKVGVKRLNPSNAQLVLTQFTTPEKVKLYLQTMGRLPLSNDVSEQKVLVFNSENNSFAITQKD